ncbi:hypothetical protein J6590_092785 [Homalodisca vitripennis]|nr:hypothetical protein J6590_092785 [Homalodisca vitripennis]
MKLGPTLEVMLIAKTTGPGVLATHTLSLKLKFPYTQNNRHMVCHTIQQFIRLLQEDECYCCYNRMVPPAIQSSYCVSCKRGKVVTVTACRERDTCGRYFHTGGGAADRAIIWHYTCPGPAHTCTDTDVTNYTALLVVWYSPTGTDVTRETCKILTAELQITYCFRNKDSSFLCFLGGFLTALTTSAARLVRLNTVTSVSIWADLWSTGHAH